MNFIAIILLFLSPFIGRLICLGNHIIGSQQASLLTWPRFSFCNQKLHLKTFLPTILWPFVHTKCPNCKREMELKSFTPEMLSVSIVAICWFLLPSELLIWGCMLGWGLLFLAITDWHHFTLPNVITYSLIPLGLLFAYLNHNEQFIHYCIGCVIGYLIFLLIRWVYKLLRKSDGLGLGDAKLMAVAGAWCAWWAIPWITLIGSVTALLAVVLLPKFRNQLNANLKIPFGTFLSIAIGIVFIMQMSNIVPRIYWM